MDRLDHSIEKHHLHYYGIDVARQGKHVIYSSEGISESSLFDIASLTKLFTATLVLKMIERGEMSLNDTVQKFFPEMKREEVTIGHLLSHTSTMQVPLSEVRKIAQDRKGYEKAIFSAAKIPEVNYCYQCSNYIVLGWIAEKIGGNTLDILMEKEVLLSLKMFETHYGVKDTEKLSRTIISATDPIRGEVRGEVHDPNSYLLGGVSGNAGIFTTLKDFRNFTDMWLQRGEFQGERILKEETVENAWKAHYQSHGKYAQGLGWKLETPHETDPWTIPGSKLHGGFTGTFTLLIPKKNFSCTIFTDFLHSHGEEETRKGTFREVVGDIFKTMF